MAKVNIWGRNAAGKITAFAIGVPTDLVAEYRAKAEADGWTDLLTSKYESNPEPSESSDDPQSLPKSVTISTSSGGSSTDSAVASRRSRRKASRTP